MRIFFIFSLVVFATSPKNSVENRIIGTNHFEKQQPPAKNFINIYSKYDGTPGYIIYNWYAANTSKTASIRIVVRFIPPNANYAWNQTFDLLPGTVKNIGNETYDGKTYVYTSLISAIYI